MEKIKSFKATSLRIRVLTEMYNPEQFPAMILKRNETVWLKAVEDAFVDFMAAVFDLELDNSLEYKIKEVKMSIQKFVTTYNIKVMSVGLEADALLQSAFCSDSKAQDLNAQDANEAWDTGDKVLHAVDEVSDADEDPEATGTVVDVEAVGETSDAVAEDHNADEEALEVSDDAPKACGDLEAVVEARDSVGEAHGADAPVVENATVEDVHEALDAQDAGDVANSVVFDQVDGLTLHCNDCGDDLQEFFHAIAGDVKSRADGEEQVDEDSVDGEQVPVDNIESVEVGDEQVTEADVTVTVVDPGGPDDDENFDDGDVKVAAEPEPYDVKKVTVNVLVTAFSDPSDEVDPTDAVVDPTDAEVDPTEVAVDPINAEIVPFDAAVVPSGENLRLSLYHRNKTKQGKTVVARLMSDLKSDKVEPFIEGEDVAEEIKSPDIENELEVFDAVFLENTDDCDATHLCNYSDVQDEFDVADQALVPYADVHEAADLYTDVKEPDIAGDALMSALLVDVGNGVDDALVFVLLEFIPFFTLLESHMTQSSIDL